jgi:hypothetical protein
MWWNRRVYGHSWTYQQWRDLALMHADQLATLNMYLDTHKLGRGQLGRNVVTVMIDEYEKQRRRADDAESLLVSANVVLPHEIGGH